MKVLMFRKGVANIWLEDQAKAEDGMEIVRDMPEQEPWVDAQEVGSEVETAVMVGAK